MKHTEFEAKQYKVLDSFYKEIISANSMNVGFRMITGILLFCQSFFVVLPYQDVDGKATVPALLLGVLGAGFYIQPYINQHKEGGAVFSIYDKLKYLPVSAKLLRKYWFRKLIWFLFRYFAVCLGLQVIFSFLSYHEVVWGNIWHPFLFTFLCPLVLNGYIFKL